MAADSIRHCEQALMFTDIVGYSRLMGLNETLAIEMLGDYRHILLSHIEGQGGQLVEFAGDAIFARFDTASSAVAAAIAIQQHLSVFNEARDKKLPRLQTRIGLHKGEVMVRDGSVLGDNVNIAARLEPLAVAEGICISQSIYDEIRLTLSSPAKRLGLQTLKNIQQKICVYLIKPAGIGWRDHAHYFLRGLNTNIITYRYPLMVCAFASIAASIYFVPRWLVPGYAANYVEVADFKNLMNEKGDADYFSAGITEAVRSQLADMRDVYIVDAKEGIRAPIRLEGSVQKLGDNLRIAYRLLRRRDNVQMVGGKLDGTSQDIFILQDRLVGEIARHLADEFKLQSFRPAPLRLTSDTTAYDFYLRGNQLLSREMNQKNIDEAIQFFSQAIVHDVDFSLAYAGLCQAYLKKYHLNYSPIWLGEADKNCLLSLEKDRYSAKSHAVIGLLHKEKKEYKEALHWLKEAEKLDTDDPSIMINIASVHGSLGDSKKAEEIYRQAIKRYPKYWLAFSSYGFYLMQEKRYRESINVYQQSLKILPENPVVFNNIAANYMYLNDFKGAAEAFENASKIEPNSFVFGNSGSLYYLSSHYDDALKMYKLALELEPDNYEWQVNIADLYKYGIGDDVLSKRYYQMALDALSKFSGQGDLPPKNYQFMARAYIGLGDIESAESAIKISDLVDKSSVDANYSHLKIAIEKDDFASARYYARQLIDSGYSYDLIKADPGLAYLHEGDALSFSENRQRKMK